ncbi:hypothetical protein BV22DRAFT_1025108, partial [Leucogyrophana mollusca]
FLDVARGLESIHSFDPVVIHGDLKGANIPSTANLRACVADLCRIQRAVYGHFWLKRSGYHLVDGSENGSGYPVMS